MTLLLLGNGIPKRVSIPAYEYRTEQVQRVKRKREDEEIIVMAYSMFTEYEVRDDKRSDIR